MGFKIPSVVSIAGSDSSGGAGIQADLKTIEALGLFAQTAITALTAQNTLGVSGVLDVPIEFVVQQIDAVFDDIRPGAVKICTMPIGYADGFRRGLSGRTDVLLAGRRFHQVGNICMDQSMFEVNLRQRNDLDPQIGDTVTIVGEQGEASVTIDQMAETLGTIQHEVAIGFGCSRLPRLYV